MKHNGGLEFRTISETDYQFRTRIQDIHLNPGSVTHGGFIMSLMDSGMGTAAHRVLGKNARAATGPEPAPDDVDPRPPAVVTWADDGLFVLLASDSMTAIELIEEARSLYPPRP